jgi:two-component system response regulator PilR (NtrC family)
MKTSRILVVEDDVLLREQVCLALRGDWEVHEASDPEAAAGVLDRTAIDVLLLDLQLRQNGSVEDGFSVLRDLRRRSSDAMVIVMTGDKHHGTRLRAVDEGAYDCFMKPFDVREVRLMVQRCLERLELMRENSRLKAEMLRQASFEQLVGCSEAMAAVYETIRRVADSPATVLIQGESGTGKELAARAVHFLSSRRDAPFIPVHCSALPETLIETELFGHEKGAFTGAVSAREGRFELAHRGTLFLDEVGTLNPNLQTKLLRVLEEKQFERIGGRKTIQVDVRLVAATNENLEDMASRGAFREDLFFRLNVIPIRMPPLRERKDDIPILANHFLRQYCTQYQIPQRRVSAEALQLLMAHEWKGNVRELENVVQRCVLLSDCEEILPKHLPPQLSSACASRKESQTIIPAEGLNFSLAVEQYERKLLDAALQATGGVKMRAARLLKLSKEQMKYLCRKHYRDKSADE